MSWQKNNNNKLTISILSFNSSSMAPGGASGKESACQYRNSRRHRFAPWVRKIPWRSKWQPTPVFLPGESHGQRSLAGYSPRGCKESGTTEHACNTCTHTQYQQVTDNLKQSLKLRKYRSISEYSR